MGKIFISEERDIWAFLEHKKGSSLCLCLEGISLNGVTRLDADLDEMGHPHLLLENQGKLLYLSWRGDCWDCSLEPLGIGGDQFFICVAPGKRPHIIIGEYGSEPLYRHIYSIKRNWYEERLNFLPVGCRIVGFFSWSQSLLGILFSIEGFPENSLGLAWKTGDGWNQVEQITTGKKIFLNWYLDSGELYVLTGYQLMEGAVLSLYQHSLDLPGNWRCRTIGMVDGWDEPPVICNSGDGNLMLCWQRQGLLSYGLLRRSEGALEEIHKTHLFYPVSFTTPTGTTGFPADIVLNSIYGIELAFPLVISIKKLVEMHKSATFHSNHVTRSLKVTEKSIFKKGDHTGL